MHKVYVSILLSLFLLEGIFAQTVKGYVYDQISKEPLQGVTIYFDATSLGTVTNEKGFFSLTSPSKLSTDVVVSYMGYSTVRISNPYQDKPFQVFLQESSFGLEEVVVIADPFSRAEKLAVFKAQFLGSDYEKKCTLKNPEVLHLAYDVQGHTLIATAKEPLYITNSYLGYDVQYTLVGFEAQYYKETLDTRALTSVFFAGSSYFQDVSEGEQKYNRRRKNSYLGSAIHLMRTIVKEDWENEGFRLFKRSFQVNPKEHFTLKDTLGFTQLTATQPKWNILYKKSKQSAMQMQGEAVYIDEFGNFTPVDALVFSGYVGSLRFQDMLPLDYTLEE